MSLNKNSLLMYEAGQKPQGKVAMTDSGDKIVFSSALKPWSKRSEFEYDVKPDGLDTGGGTIPAVSGSNDVVDVAALACYLAGILTSVSAGTDLALTRGATTNTHMINSITVTSAGALAVVAGTATTAFSETRGAAGGPPFIPVGSIEIAQVRMTSITAAPITASEIFAVPGTHQERSDFPGWEEDPASGKITFDEALPDSHTGNVAKGVYVDYSIPSFAPISIAGDFKASSNSQSVSSENYYNNKTLASVTESLGQGSFIAKLKDGITDPIVKLEGEVLWFKYFQNKNRTPHILDQGILGIDTDFSATDHPTANCTISAEQAHVKVDA